MDWFTRRVSGIYFNAMITFIDSTFLIFAVSALINVRTVYEGFLQKDTAYTLSVVSLSILLFELLSVSIFLWCNRRRLDEKYPQERCGFMFNHLNYKIRGDWTLMYPILY